MSRLFKQLLAEKVIEKEIPETEKSSVDLKLVVSQEDGVVQTLHPPTKSPKGKKFPILAFTLVMSLFVIAEFALIQYYKKSSTPVAGATPGSNVIRVDSSKTDVVANRFPEDLEANRKAIKLYKEKNYRAALDAFNTLLFEYPASPELMNNIGLTYAKLKSYKRARSYFTTVVKKSKAEVIAPVLASAYNNLGTLSLAGKDYTQAINYFQKAILIDSSLIESRLNLGQALEQGGKINDAIFAYESYINIPTSDPATNEILKKRVVKLRQLVPSAFRE